MEDQRQARQLASQGRFAAALRALPDGDGPAAARNELAVLRADLLERTGAHRQSRVLLDDLLRRRTVSAGERSECGLILSRLAWNDGDINAAISHVQRAITDARS